MRYVTPVAKVRCEICSMLYDPSRAKSIRVAGRLFSQLPASLIRGRFVRINGTAFVILNSLKSGGLHRNGSHYHTVEIALKPLSEQFGNSDREFSLVYIMPNTNGNVFRILQSRPRSFSDQYLRIDIVRLVVKPRLNRAEKLQIPLSVLFGISMLVADYKTTVGQLVNAYGISRIEVGKLFFRRLADKDFALLHRVLQKLGVL